MLEYSEKINELSNKIERQYVKLLVFIEVPQKVHEIIEHQILPAQSVAAQICTLPTRSQQTHNPIFQ